jgi:hypothetical protein
MLLPYIQHGLCGTIWTQAPEPDRVMGRSLSLICLVMHHQGSRGCPSPESGTHEECFRTQPACCEKTGMRVQKSFSAVASAEATVSREICSTGHRDPQEVCGAAPGGGQQPKSSQPRTLDEDGSLNVIGRPPYPRRAFVCPLDNGGLRGVRSRPLEIQIPGFR